uniref:Protein RFT1 homolog n=1 Tax=Heterorhabditis bacteriophora TaxID=37862 RepID=A0A1I7WEX9_HETBA
MYLLRIVDNNILGIVNVRRKMISCFRLTLLYNTILFLTREPMRKANVLKSSTPHFVNLIWLRYGLDLSSISVVSTLFLHSLLKQLLTDGSAYVMTFTEILSLKNQAVFDAVEKLGSLVARVVLAPLEENCFAYFSNVMNKDSDFFNRKTDSHDHLLHMFTTILHIVSVIGMIVCIFGVSYSQLAVWLYGGNLLYHNEGGLLLSLYSVYLFVLSINGITECFSMASMNNSQVLCHGGFLLIAAALHLFLSLILSFYCGSAGFIIANSINMVFRIWYSWRHITSRLGSRSPPFLKICPTFSTSIFLLFALVATIISSLRDIEK